MHRLKTMHYITCRDAQARCGMRKMCLPQVPMNRRPVCAAANQAQCLASSVATGTALTTPYVVSANAWASDNALAYDFGVQHPDGTQCAARSA